jgi:hypothetical protein
MLVIRTENRRWWSYEIYLAPRLVKVLRGIGIWLGRTGAILGGLVLPGLLVTVLVFLQLTSEPDLEGGFEGVEGCFAVLFGGPAACIGAVLGAVTLPSAWRRRFVLAVVVLGVILFGLGLAQMLRYELVR